MHPWRTFIIKFFGILLISMLAHVANGKDITMQVESAGSDNNAYISIEMDYNGRVGKTTIEQSITNDDDLQMDYVIEDNVHEIKSGSTSFCNPEPSSEGANIVDFAKKALGIADGTCPIQPQTIKPRTQVIKGELEIDESDPLKVIDLSIILKKGDKEVVGITFTGSLKK